ncbi:hypothetical protein Csa_011846 [Cucumis sativus]|uniref:Uncharacterized protein n=1 Tax=Cucumis sativus TaxID=3659 RepID=A0A0A0KYY4_CUCSA|nr:hypothetical protein Csa_011846 [Cucumis sativus]
MPLRAYGHEWQGWLVEKGKARHLGMSRTSKEVSMQPTNSQTSWACSHDKACKESEVGGKNCQKNLLRQMVWRPIMLKALWTRGKVEYK